MDQRASARLLRNYLLRMGPLYVKAGQILGTQTGVMAQDATEEFRSFFSGLTPMRSRDLRETLATTCTSLSINCSRNSIGNQSLSDP